MSSSATPPSFTQPPQAPAPKKTWLLWVIIPVVGLLVCCGVCGGLFYGVFQGVVAAIKSSDAYKTALVQVQQDPVVKEKLGEPITDTGMPMGNFKVENNSGSADFTFDVEGPKGKGTVAVDAAMSAGTWRLTSLSITFADGEEHEIAVGGGEEPPADEPAAKEPAAEDPPIEMDPAAEEPASEESSPEESAKNAP